MVCRRAARGKDDERGRDRPVRTPLTTTIKHCRLTDPSEDVLASSHIAKHRLVEPEPTVESRTAELQDFA